MTTDKLILCLCGGVGGAKLARGLSQLLPPEELLIAVNTGDDFEHLGLHISPDLDSVMYALAGLNDAERGWGLAQESWQFMQMLAAYGAPVWFNLGDKDLATHIQRTEGLRQGLSLDAITLSLCRSLGVQHRVVPMSNDPVQTRVNIGETQLPFQDYFVRLRCEPPVQSVEFAGAGQATLQPDFGQALHDAAAIIICPSNPFLSIAPILAVADVKTTLQNRTQPVFAVSPLIQGRAVKGPAAKLMRELGLPVDNTGIAGYYRGLIDYLIIDEADKADQDGISQTGITPMSMPTLMRDEADRVRLAERIMQQVRATQPNQS
ncbi:MAG: 2-phospho-L-lactate transferase [Gammaproteobacteria bacterium]